MVRESGNILDIATVLFAAAQIVLLGLSTSIMSSHL